MSETTPTGDTVPFEKYHGTGNDFLLIDAYERVPNRGGLAERECDRDRGVGADGILFLALEPDYRPPRVVMTLFQPDGRTAPMCGNGARCAAVWAMERTDADAVMIDTQAGTRRAERVEDGISLEMGRPSFEPADVPVDADEALLETEIEGLPVTAVDTGVPHAVAFVDDVEDVDLESVGPSIRHAEIFPQGSNVTVASPDDGGFRQRTFERGVEDETRSCGTGAVAIAAVARRLGLNENDSIPVRPPGGDLRVEFRGDDSVDLVGPVAFEFDGKVSVEGPFSGRS